MVASGLLDSVGTSGLTAATFAEVVMPLVVQLLVTVEEVAVLFRTVVELIWDWSTTPIWVNPWAPHT